MLSFKRPDRALIDAFRDAPTAVISDNLDRLAGLDGLRPFHRKGHLVGPARTVRTRPGDNQFIHKMLDLVEPGDVVVVAGEGDVSRALVGEIMMTIARKRGVAGFVIDGAIRDSAAFAASDFPCFARGVNHRGPYKDGPGALDEPVAISGNVVSPGDIVVGDEDGVVTFSPDIVEELASAVQRQLAREAAIMRSIADGTYTGAYAKK
ncbi:MAG: RraA family protein [Rhodoblastus sp.]|nr:RraA family protein [Rhodoblastus sp.]